MEESALLGMCDGTQFIWDLVSNLGVRNEEVMKGNGNSGDKSNDTLICFSQISGIRSIKEKETGTEKVCCSQLSL